MSTAKSSESFYGSVPVFRGFARLMDPARSPMRWRREFPFVFGGDGASFAVSLQETETARKALAATATWVMM